MVGALNVQGYRILYELLYSSLEIVEPGASTWIRHAEVRRMLVLVFYLSEVGFVTGLRRSTAVRPRCRRWFLGTRGWCLGAGRTRGWGGGAWSTVGRGFGDT
jgi:hypothetical protein